MTYTDVIEKKKNYVKLFKFVVINLNVIVCSAILFILLFVSFSKEDCSFNKDVQEGNSTICSDVMNEKLKNVYTSQDLNNFNDFFSQFNFKKFTSDEKMYELIMFRMVLHILILNQTSINYEQIVLNFHKIALNFNQIVINFYSIQLILCN